MKFGHIISDVGTRVAFTDFGKIIYNFVARVFVTIAYLTPKIS